MRGTCGERGGGSRSNKGGVSGSPVRDERFGTREAIELLSFITQGGVSGSPPLTRSGRPVFDDDPDQTMVIKQREGEQYSPPLRPPPSLPLHTHERQWSYWQLVAVKQ